MNKKKIDRKEIDIEYLESVVDDWDSFSQGHKRLYESIIVVLDEIDRLTKIVNIISNQLSK